MKYVIKEFEDNYYKIPIEREDEFDELVYIDSGYNINDWYGSYFAPLIFNKYLIEKEDYIVVEKDGVYYNIPESFEYLFKYYVKLSGEENLSSKSITLIEYFKLEFDDYIISVE